MSTGKPSATARAEAAAWLARLHGPNRTADVEAGFRRWLSEDPQRAAAFELITDTWEKSARLRRRPSEHMASWQLPGFRLSLVRATLAAAVVAALAVIGTAFYFQDGTVSTRVGEQRTLTLEDGSRVYLNTGTRIAQLYDEQARHIELQHGEAFFEVAKNPDWPFVVTAGERRVQALGTSFVVRKDADTLSVTLVEGKVVVSATESLSARAALPSPAVPAAGSAEHRHDPEITLSPGERLTFASAQSPQLDRPPLERVTAWQRGQVALDNTPLGDAVAEMNRYSNTRLMIENPHIAAIPVSGIFRAGDQDDFARAVAKTYELRLVERDEEIVITEGAANQRQP